MYLAFYGLKEQPFNITPDSRFLFLSQRHKEALASLLYGIEQRKGFIVITGEIGSGKTTLCRALLKELDSEQVKIALIFNPLLTEVELLRAINHELGIEHQLNSKKDLIDELNEFLLEAIKKGQNVVVVIDEAQNLTPVLLEQLRLLSNLETETEKLLQIVLIGQPELQSTLELPQLQQLNQRVAVRYHLEPLSKEEVMQYIKHRLEVAGAKVDIKFTPGAVDLIYEYTEGVPRKINILCDRILLIGYVQGTYEIDRDIVETAIEEVSGMRQTPLPGSKGLGILKPRVVKGPIKQRLRIPREILAGILGGLVLIILLVAGGIYWIHTYLTRSLEEFIYHQKGNSGQEQVVSKPEQVAVGKIANLPNPQNTPEQNPAFTPTPKPTPIERKVYEYNWEYDDKGIVRVSKPYFSYQASILNWLTLWGIKPDLTSLRQLTYDEIMALNITGTSSKLGLRKVELNLPFSDLINLDLPVVLNLNAAEINLSPWVVLKQVQGYAVTLIDTVRGHIVITRGKLESAYIGAIGLYFDKDNLVAITTDEESERVMKLQNFLLQAGFMQGKPSGKFDVATISAIEKLQQKYKLPVSGKLDPITVMIITSRQQPNRPRLFSKEDLE